MQSTHRHQELRDLPALFHLLVCQQWNPENSNDIMKPEWHHETRESVNQQKHKTKQTL